MKKLKLQKFIELLLLVSLAYIPFVPTLRSLDLIGPQFLYLSITQLFFSLYFLFNKKHREKKIAPSIPFYFALAFLIICFFSIFWSLNYSEGIIDFSRHLIIIVAFGNIINLLFLNRKYKYYVICLLIIMLTVESSVIFKIFIENYSFSKGLGRIRDLQGLSSNQNVSAFSILIKIPLVIYGIFKTNYRLLKNLLYIPLTISFFCILIIGSRGALLSLYFVMILFFVFIFFQNKITKVQLPLEFKKVIFTSAALFFIISVVQTTLYKNNEALQSINRIGSLADQNDESVSKRSRYYPQAINAILQNPIGGIGIGTWKIESINYDHQNITQYQVPFHLHNDFLQMFAETGLIGGLFYFLIFTSTILLLYRRLKKTKEENLIILIFLLITSLLIYFIDANLNFPRARPFSQYNLIYILGISCVLIKGHIKKLSINLFKISTLTIFLLVPITFISYKIFKSLQEQVLVYYDFNENRSDLKVPFEIAKNFQEDFPNITMTCIPISNAKANYYIQEKDYDKAKELAKKGLKHNPYLGIAENQLATIFFEEKNYDSAYYYSKISLKKLPQNTSHITMFQKILASLNKRKEAKEIFKKNMHLKDINLWSNHALLLVSLFNDGDYSFDNDDKDFIKKAIKIYPEDKWIKAAEKIINTGYIKSIEAQNFDLRAMNFFKEQKFEKAIENWNMAIKIIPNEDSYYLNIAHSYLFLEEYFDALDVLRKIEKLGIKGDDGKFEFLTATAFYSSNEKSLACNYLRESIKLGYKNSSKFKSIFCE